MANLHLCGEMVCLKLNGVHGSIRFGVSECFSCYLVHQVMEAGMFKVALMPPSGQGILVSTHFSTILIFSYGCFPRM